MQQSEGPDSNNPWSFFVEKKPILGYWEFWVDEKRFSCSTDFFKSLGYRFHRFKPGELIAFEWLHADDKQIFNTHLKNLIRSGRKGSAVFRLTDSSGATRYVKSTGKLLKSSGKAPRKLVGVFHDETELKQLKAETARTRKMQDLLLHASGEGIYGVDKRGVCTFINKAAVKMLGYSLSECVGVNIHNLIHQHKRQQGWRGGAVQKSIASARVIRVEEAVFRRKNGQEIYVRYSSTPVIDDGKIQGAIVVFSEISGLHQPKQVLEKSREELQHIMDSSVDVICTIDEHGNFLKINDACKKLWGYKPEHLIGKPCLYLVHEADRAKTAKASAAVMAGRRTTSFKNRYRKRDGSIVPLIWSAVWDSSARLMYCVARHAAERDPENEKLRSNERRFRSLLQEGSDLITILDSKGNYVYISPTSSTVLGVRPAVFIGKNVFDFIHPDDLKTVKGQFEKLKNEKRVEFSPFRFIDENGNWRWIRTTATNLMDDPAVAGIVTNSKDVTDDVIFQKVDVLEKELMQGSIREGYNLEELLGTYLSGLEGLFEGMKTSLFRIANGKMFSYLSPSLSEKYLACFDNKKVEVLADSLGAAAHTVSTVITVDITTDPQWKKVAKCALKEGLRACWLIPIFNSKGVVVATFANYYTAAKHPSESELEILRRSGSLIGLIIENYSKTHAISESNERYELINEVTKDAIYDWDVVNDVFYWGESFYRLFNYPRSEKVFRLADWSELMHPYDREINEIPWAEFLNDKTQNKWVKEFRFKCGPDRYAYVEETGRIIRDQKGKPVRMVGVLRDITANRKYKYQRELQYAISRFFKSDQPLNKILDSVLSYLVNYAKFNTGELWLADSKRVLLKLHSCISSDERSATYFTYGSRQSRFLYGQGLPGTVVFKNKTELWNNLAENPDFIRRDAAHAAGLSTSVGIPVVFNDLPIGVLMFCTRDKISEDIIEWYKSVGSMLGAELKRKQQEEEMQILFESAPEILAIVSPEGYFTKVNKAFCDLMGMTADEIISQPFINFVHPDDLSGTVAAFEKTITDGQKTTNFINRYKTKDGTYKWISWASSELFGDEGYTFAYGRDVTDIRRLEKLLDDATKMTRVGAWEVDLKTNAIYWSALTRKIYEVSSDFVPDFQNGLGFYKEGLPQETVAKLFMECMETGRSWDIEVPIVTAKGNESWVRIMGEAEFTAGKCSKVFGSIQDIDRQKRAEFQLHKLILERDNILERISDAFFAIDTNWVVTYWNREAERILGIRKHEIIAERLWDFYPQAERPEFYGACHKAMNSKETVHFEEHYPKTNTWVEVSIYPSDSGLSVFFRDISLRRLAEEQIRQSNERFDNVAKATNDAIWDWDIVQNTLYWGDGYSKLFGYEINRVVPSLDSWIKRIHPDDVGYVLESIDRAVNSTDTDSWQQEYRYLKADQTYAFVIDRGIVIRDHSGRAVRMTGAMADITYRKDYEESLRLVNDQLVLHAKELEASNKELEQFAYVASHDLQEPLRMVTSFLTQLDNKYTHQLDDRAKTYISFAVDGAVRMRQIILDLLEFSRLRKFDDPHEEIDLNQLIKDVCVLQQKLIEEKKAEINVAPLPVIKTFRSPVSRVFQNLISNALKYTKTDVPPKIEVKVEDSGTDWIFSVSDNGIGIEKEYHEKIFVIFQRLHGKNEFAGTGMGLAIVKKIIENMKGKIWIESELGKGSTFYFSLPR